MEQEMVRTSERGTFKRCPRKWWWAWVEGLTTKEPSKALWFGTGWHEVLADYYQPGYKRSKDYIDKWREFCDTPDAEGQYQPADDMGEEWVELRKLGEVMLQEYVKEYDGDKDWDVIQPEYSGQVMIPTWDGTGKIQYNFTFDGVYRDKRTKKIRLMEHKSAKVISINHLSIDEQAGGYWAVAPTILRHRGILGKRDTIQGIMYNFARKGLPDKRPVGPDGYARNKPNKAQYLDAMPDAKGSMSLPKLEALAAERGIEVLGDISKNQPTPLFKRHMVLRTPKERRSQIDHIKKDHALMEAVRSGQLPVTKTPTRDCSWECAFFTMCELADSQGDVEEFKKQVYIKRDMHEVHRLDRKVA